MAPAIEAGSLASVIDLADNPPKYLQCNATTSIKQPLVLYIARVPGSKGWSLLIVQTSVHS